MDHVRLSHLPSIQQVEGKPGFPIGKRFNTVQRTKLADLSSPLDANKFDLIAGP